MNGFPVTVQPRGAALKDGAGQAGMRPGPAWAGDGAAGDERSGCQPRRPGPAALAVAREFRPGTGRGAWLPGDGECVRVRADPGATPGQGSRPGPLPRGRGARGTAQPGTPSRRVCRPPVPATPATPSLAGRQAASRPRSKRRMTSRAPPDASPGPAWPRCHLPGARPGQAAGHAGLAGGPLTASQGTGRPVPGERPGAAACPRGPEVPAIAGSQHQRWGAAVARKMQILPTDDTGSSVAAGTAPLRAEHHRVRERAQGPGHRSQRPRTKPAGPAATFKAAISQ